MSGFKITRTRIFGLAFILIAAILGWLLLPGQYTTVEGDTAEDLADRFRVPVEVFQQANAISDPDADLPTGTALTVPSVIYPGAITVINFGIGAQAITFTVNTLLWVAVVVVLYAATGVLALLDRWPQVSRWLLITSGVLLIPSVLIAAAVGQQTNLLTMLVESMRLATPIAIGAAAGIWAERSGVVNIAIEGMMLNGAAIGFVVFTLVLPFMPNTSLALFTGVMGAIAGGALMALLHAWLSITYKTDQIVSGTVINILAIGVSSFLRREILLNTDSGRITLPTLRIPLLADIPIIGDVFFQNRPIFYSMFVILILTHVILYYTPFGLRLRSVGENPEAADTVGINVTRMRYLAVLISGAIAGLGGAWFSLETVGGFDDQMTGGRGFIALAAVIFGNWNPGGAFAGALLFGFADALATRFQILQVPVPPQWLQMLPFITTMVVLAGLIGRTRPPAAVGKPYEK